MKSKPAISEEAKREAEKNWGALRISDPAQMAKIRKEIVVQEETAAAVAETLDAEGSPPALPSFRRKKWSTLEKNPHAPRAVPLPRKQTESPYEIVMASRIRSKEDLAAWIGATIYGLVTEDNKSDYERLSIGDMFELGAVLELEVSVYHGMPMIKLKGPAGTPKISLRPNQIAHFNLYSSVRAKI